MTKCEALQAHLKAYADGELSLLLRLKVRLHLARCASCREEIRVMEQIGKELLTGDAGTLEPALRARILASIPDAPPAKPARASAFSARRLVIAGGAAAALLLGLVYLPRSNFSPLAGGASEKAAQEATASAPAGSAKSARPAETKSAPAKTVSDYTTQEMEKRAANAPLPTAPPEVKRDAQAAGRTPADEPFENKVLTTDATRPSAPVAAGRVLPIMPQRGAGQIASGAGGERKQYSMVMAKPESGRSQGNTAPTSEGGPRHRVTGSFGGSPSSSGYGRAGQAQVNDGHTKGAASFGGGRGVPAVSLPTIKHSRSETVLKAKKPLKPQKRPQSRKQARKKHPAKSSRRHTTK